MANRDSGRLSRWLMSAKDKLQHTLEKVGYSVNTHAVVVLGDHKSGSFGVADLIADACQVGKTLQIPELWSPAIERILDGEATLKSVTESHPKAFSTEVVHEPFLTFIYDEVKKVFPGGKFCFVCRDPRESIRSELSELKIPGDLEEVDLEKQAVPPEWRLAFDPARWGSESAHYVDVLAARWNRAADVYAENRKEMQLIRFEDFVADRGTTIQTLVRKIGLLKTGDLASRLSEKRETRPGTPAEFFGPNLQRIVAACGERMQQFGYKG